MATVADPMGSEAERNRRLHSKWRNMDERSEDFQKFPDFLDWAIRTGYEVGDYLRRLDESQPYGPENCYWEHRGTKSKMNPAYELRREHRERAYEWNRVVNRIRRYVGLEPFPETEEEQDDL